MKNKLLGSLVLAAMLVVGGCRTSVSADGGSDVSVTDIGATSIQTTVTTDACTSVQQDVSALGDFPVFHSPDALVC